MKPSIRTTLLQLISALCWLALGGCEKNPEVPSSTLEEPVASNSQTGEESPKIAIPYSVTHIDVADASKLIAGSENIVVLDVRTPDEFSRGHIEGAINIDFQSNEFSESLSGLNQNDPWIIHCAIGGRSTQALAILEDSGAGKVYHLDGGFQAWENAGYEIAK